jgi:hypothetical protein
MAPSRVIFTAVPLPCHSQRSCPVPSGTTTDNTTGHDLCRSPPTHAEILPNLALGGSRFAQALVGSVPGRSG